MEKTSEKGYTCIPRQTEEVKKISEIQHMSPITFKIRDEHGEEIQGTFYEQELQKMNQEVFRIENVIRKGKNKSFGRVTPIQPTSGLTIKV